MENKTKNHVKSSIVIELLDIFSQLNQNGENIPNSRGMGHIPKIVGKNTAMPSTNSAIVSSIKLPLVVLELCL